MTADDQQIVSLALATAVVLGNWREAEAIISRIEIQGNLKAAAMGKLLLAERKHDAASALALARSPVAEKLRLDLRAREVLASCLHWTVGIAEAQQDSVALCRSGLTTQESAKYCAWAALGERLSGYSLLALDSDRDVAVELFPLRELPIFRASVNHLCPEYFIFDTGASTTLLSKSYCDRHGVSYMSEYPYRARDAAGNELTLYPAILQSFTVAELTFQTCTASVTSFSPDIQVAGIIAPQDTFRNVSSELDLRRRLLRVYPRLTAQRWTDLVAEPVHHSPLIWDEGTLFVSASVDNEHHGYFLLDTAAGANLLSPSFAQKVGKGTSRAQAIHGTTLGGKAVHLPGFSGRLCVDDSRPVTTEFLLKQPPPRDRELAPLLCAGYVGLPWLAQRRILFSRGGAEMVFTEPVAR